ncbi:MAG: SDR family NAD(P)-dependent oxidoreductase [Gammaproteobacteria bacterium]
MSTHKTENPTLLTYLEKNVVIRGSQIAYIFLADGETAKERLTYAQLHKKAHAIAGHLQQLAKLGDRIVLCYEPGLDFICAFLGCWYAGMIAVPAYPLRNNRHAHRLYAIVEDCQPALILGTSESIALMQTIELFSSSTFVLTETISDAMAKQYQPCFITSDSLAFLQYTSGSTGKPKGVMVSHGNVIENHLVISQSFGATCDDTSISWLPIQHDMGLIGNLLYTIFSGGTEVCMPPTAFLEKPIRWLNAISYYHAYGSGGPNFAYQLCVDHIRTEEMQDCDLSSWKIAFNGAEPIRASTLAQFIEKFKPYGFNSNAFSPCYGMAETTLMVCAKPRNTLYSTHTFGQSLLVSSGLVFESYTAKIVDPQTRKVCGKGEIGEIWLSGPSVAQGYWNNPEATANTFHAHLLHDSHHYLRTGDLGYLLEQELYIAGRLKDLIILQGQNIYPQDIEGMVETSHAAIRKNCIAAFSADINEQEQLVIVAEVERRYRKIDFKPVFHAIRKALIDELGIVPFSIQLLAPAKSLKTTSGKIQRNATKASYLQGTLLVIASDDLWSPLQGNIPTRSIIYQQIIEMLCKILGVEEISAQKTFSELGGTSLHAILFHEQLQAYVGNRIELSPSVALDYPTVDALSAFLFSQLTGAFAPRTIPFKTSSLFSTEPIAIIGMSCRFPHAENPEAFWKLLSSGGDGIELIPKSRWDWEVYYDKNPEMPDKTYVKHGGFIEGIEYFDAAFFGISPREAEMMDPQQRLVLETTWHALQDAGIDPSSLRNSDTSVFVGASSFDYENLLAQQHVHNNYVATGNTASVLAGRVSYELGLQGPSLTLDTACSSSLTALHEACNSLHLGETSLAIVSGVNVLLLPDGFINLSNVHMLSPEGRCKVFDESADGYVRAEGCGVVILKKLSEAQRDKDRILAVICSAVLNQDGASSGLTVPNGAAQEQLLREALSQAHLQPHEISYLETHGTGTKLGDPMETHAIATVYEGSHQNRSPLIIGSAKANIGHLEAAAGMAGIIKVILSMWHEAIPPQINVAKLNPKINLTTVPMQIPQELKPWKKNQHKRRAGISSFGFSGTNAHVILEEAPDQDPTQVRESLPKTEFHRERYWAKSLDKAREYALVFPRDWYFERRWIMEALMKGKGKRFKHYLIVANDEESSLVNTTDFDNVQMVAPNALAACLADKEQVCVIDATSWLAFKDQPIDLESTEALLARYQGWFKESVSIKRWVILNGCASLSSCALYGLAQILNWESKSEVQYIAGESLSSKRVAEEIRYGDEPYVLYQEGKRFIERIEHADIHSLMEKMTPFVADETGTYLITGGLGGLGTALTEALLQWGMKHIVLVSRRAMNEAQQERVNRLITTYQATIRHEAGDVSDAKFLEAILAGIENLQGVFHLAGNEENAAFGDFTFEQMDAILRPKLLGTWNLHTLTQGLSLKYFVLFSSISSLLGSNRQAPYLLANGYLDTLANYRKQEGLAITHLHWGPWGTVGMTAARNIAQMNGSSEFIPLDKGLGFIKQVLQVPGLQGLGVASPRYLAFMLSFHQHLPKYLAPFLKVEQQVAAESDFLQRYRQQELTLRRGMLEDFVTQLLKEVLHIEASQPINKEMGFFELGMDSLMAVELYNRIQTELGTTVTLRPMLVFDYPTIVTLRDYLFDTLESGSKQIYIQGAHYEEEAIAVIGLEGRFPGGARDAESFWENLAQGKDGIRLPEPLRWDVEKYPYRAGYLDHIDEFDASFFNISPREAEALDPQQRLLLETAWHALENSGINPNGLKDSETGVFVGISQSDYGQLLSENETQINFYQVTGTALNVAAGRLAYTFGLQGPTLAIDTACSSSLVAVHEACRSLQLHECALALAAGVNVLLVPKAFELLMQGNMLSVDGYCKTFDKEANGYARGEGCGVIILKRLSDAQKDNDRILAVIKGSAVNQDGASSGLTVPNGLAQEKVIAKALANAGVEAASVDYIEAHGTGTSLGDPIEVRALQTLYGQDRDPEHPLTISTVKTNIGHLESAAGIAGLIKTILVLQRELIPKHLHFHELNPSIRLEAIPARIPLEAIEWKRQAGRVRRAGISSFGFSGTNAHLILEEAPEQDLTQVRQSLPKTVFHREHYWLEQRPNIPFLDDMNVHPLLQHRISLPGSNDLYYESVLSEHYPEFVADHLIYGYPVIAGAGYLSLALSLAKEQLGFEYCRLSEVEFIEALALEYGVSTHLIVQAREQQIEGHWQLEVYSQTRGQKEQLRVRMQLEEIQDIAVEDSLAALHSRFPAHTEYTSERHHARAAELALSLGPHFSWIEAVYTQGTEVLAHMRVAQAPVETHSYVIYPGLIDSTFQSLLALAGDEVTTLSIPFFIQAVEFNVQGGQPRWIYGRQQILPTKQRRMDFIWFDEEGQVVGRVSGFVAQDVKRAALERSLRRQNPLQEFFYETVWHEVKEDRKGPLIGTDEGTNTEKIVYYDARCQTYALSLEPTEKLLAFIQTLVQEGREMERVYVVTERAYSIAGEALQLEQACLNGLIKTAILEHPELNIQQVDTKDGENIEALKPHFTERADIVAKRGERWYTPRLLTEQGAARTRGEVYMAPDSCWELVQAVKGDLSSLRAQACDLAGLALGEVEIEVRAVGLNFRDVLVALDLYPGEAGGLGGDCAGVITRVGSGVEGFAIGDVVFGISLGAFRSHAVTDARLITHLPKALSFAQGASLPVVTLTADYGLYHLAQIKAGDKVLIHTGAGGVGLMAIQLAQRIGAEVYTTASVIKHPILQERGIKHIYDSRTSDFGEAILRDTNGQGVDVILNTLTSEGFKEASLKCLKRDGVFLEISKRNVYTSQEMQALRPDVVYHLIAIDEMFVQAPNTIQELLQEVVTLLQDKELQVLPITTYPLAQLPKAMRYLQQGQNIGKVVMNFPVVEISFEHQGSYLITGGLGGVGLALANYLSEHGAGRIILVSRHAQAETEAALQHLRISGAKLEAQLCDVSDKAQVQNLIRKNHTLEYPLKGIFHLAGIIDDAPLDKQSAESFEKVFAPKAIGAWYLHEVTQELDIGLDYFVLFSSLASLNGSPGQANYAAANSFLDALAQYRQQLGLPAQSLNWGPWREVGMAKNLVAVHQRQGLIPFKTTQALHALAYALKQDIAQLGVMHINWRRLGEQMMNSPSWLLALMEQKQESALILQLQAAEPEQRETILKATITNEVRKVLGISPALDVDENKGFFEMGMDSLLVLELGNRLQHIFSGHVIISSSFVLETPTINGITQRLFQELHFVAGTVSKGISIADSAKRNESAILRKGSLKIGPVSFLQQYWLTRQIFADIRGGKLISAIEIIGKIDATIFRLAVDKLVERNEILRTTFSYQTDKLMQVIHEELPYALQIKTFNESNNDRVEKIIHAEIEEASSVKCDFFNGPLFYITLIYINEQTTVVVISIHHLCTDLISMFLIMKELNEIYLNLCADINYMPPLKPIQYLDFSLWQREQYTPDNLREYKKFWQEYLRNAKPLVLPYSAQTGEVSANAGHYVEKVSGLKNIDVIEFAKNNETTPFVVYFMSFLIMASHFSGQDDLLLSVPRSGRNTPEIANLIGFVASTCLMRFDLSKSMLLKDALQLLNRNNMNVLKYYLPFDRVRSFDSDFDMGLSYKILFEYVATEKNVDNLFGYKVKNIFHPATIFDHDIIWQVEAEDNVAVLVSYATQHYRAEDIQKFVRVWSCTLEAIIRDTDESSIADLIALITKGN